MGTDLLEGDVELTEFEAIDVRTIKGVKQGANGFPILMMKGLAEPEPVAKGSRDCSCGKSYDADSKAENCEDCGKKLPDADASKATDDDPKCKTCGDTGKINDGNRDCPDCDAKPASKSLPAWHAAASALARMATVAPSAGPAGTWLALKAFQPELLAKAVAADGSVDEQPDIDGGKKVIELIAKLIGYEAQELEAGCMGEVWDIQLLCEAVTALKCWLSGEVATQMAETSDATGVVMASTGDDGAAKATVTLGAGTAGYNSPQFLQYLQGVVQESLLRYTAAKADLSTGQLNDLPDSAFAYIEDGGTKDDDGKTTPRSKRHFAIHDKAHADNAAARIAQGAKFGDQAKAKVTAAQKKFGSNSDDTSKSADVADGGTAVDTDAQGTGGLAKAVEDAVTKATEPLKAEIQSLQAFKAKVEALPVPGGPVMSTVRAQVRGEGNEDWAAKAAYFRDMAETVTDRPTADGYRKLAREADDKARTAAPAVTS